MPLFSRSRGLSASGSGTVVSSCSAPLRRRRSKSEMWLTIQTLTTAANPWEIDENFCREPITMTGLVMVIATKNKAIVFEGLS
jgi:hypothetical protein